jgi:hypothetical protein
VEVRCNEGLAIRIGPEPCVDIREDVGEASAGDCAGQPLSRESDFSWGADAVSVVEGNTGGHAIASVRSTPRGLRPWHLRTLLAREPGDLQLDHSQRQRGGPYREGEEP